MRYADRQIYEDAEVKYAAIQKSISAVLHEANAILYDGATPLDAGAIVAKSGSIFAINTLQDYPRQGIIAVPSDAHPEIKDCAVQHVGSAKVSLLLVNAADPMRPLVGLPQGLYASVTPATAKEESMGVFVMSNSTLDMTLKDGRIVSIYDKQAE